MMLLIIMLIVVTIIYEKCVEYLEDEVFTEGISKALLGKMVRELAVLGFVSFTATVVQQFVPLPEETKETFEYSHVLMFVTAIFYAVEIAVISRMLGFVVKELYQKDTKTEEEMYGAEQRHWYDPHDEDSAAVGSLRRTAASAHYWWLNSWFNPKLHRLKSTSALKVLRFHFMARNELLGKKKFQWAQYLSKSMEKNIEEMVEINWLAWVLLIGCISTFLPVGFSKAASLYVYLLLGWLLFLFEIGVLTGSEAIIDNLIVTGHNHRRAAQLLYEKSAQKQATGPSHRPTLSRGLSKKQLPTTGPADETKPKFVELLQSVKPLETDADKRHWPTLAKIRHYELQQAVKTTKAPTLVAKMHESVGELHEHDDDAQHYIKPGLGLRLMPLTLQIVMLLQCMYQALMLTMLGRDVFLHFGFFEGLPFLFCMWLPTTLMSVFVTPHVLKNFAIAFSVAHAQHDVLDEMAGEFEQAGDYSAAAQSLEVMLNAKLSDEEMLDTELVRAKVKDLAKLGEMKWRYRVVEEGESPRDQAIEILTQAKDLIDQHVELKGATAGGKGHGRAGKGEGEAGLRGEFASELSEVCQGLALTRLIFNTDRTEDGTIEALLKEALQLRQEHNLRPQLAETYNALGSLKQKVKAFEGAEAFYNKSFEIRQHLPEGEDHGKAKEQSIAQSLVSLGNLYIEMAESQNSASAEGKESRKLFFEQALEKLEASKEAYVRGFHDGHPKEAWALEALGKVHQKMGSYRLAQEAWDHAIAIRRNLQAKDTDKQMFNKELDKAEKEKAAVEEKRKATRAKLQQFGKTQGTLKALMKKTAQPAPA